MPEIDRTGFLMNPERLLEVAPPPSGGDAIQLEDGTDILLENGDQLLME